VPAAPPASRLALVVLVGVAMVAPWPFGSVQPGAVLVLTLTCLLAVAGALLAGVARGGLARAPLPAWPFLGFVLLGLAQLVPLPPSVHALLAPGSFRVWHPASEAVAAVLGPGAHPISLDPETTLRSVALVFGLGLLAGLAAPSFSRSATAARAVAAVGVSGFCLSAYAIYARSRFGNLLFGSIPVPTVRPFGSFVSKNHFAGYVEMAALLTAGLAIGLVASERARGRDWTEGSRAGAVIAAMVGAVAMALAVLVSLSRGGVVSLTVGSAALVGFLLLRSRRARTRAGLLGALALAGGVGVLLLSIVPPEAHERMRSLGGADFRLDTWRDSARAAAASPVVGLGLGSFHDAYPFYKHGHGLIRVEHAENDYLETAVEGGFVGLGLLLAAGALLLIGGGVPADATVRGIGLGAAAGLTALAVHSAVDFNLRIPSNAALAAVLAAAAAGAAPGVRALARPAAALLGAGALALAGALVVLPGPRAIDARAEAVRVAEAQTATARALRLARAEASLVGVLRRRPAHAESWLLLAGVRAAAGDARSAAALARHAAALDPTRESLQDAAARLAPAPDEEAGSP